MKLAFSHYAKLCYFDAEWDHNYCTLDDPLFMCSEVVKYLAVSALCSIMPTVS